MTSWTFEWQRDVNDWVQYEPKVNDILSDALSREQTTVEFSGSNGIVYVINFNQKTQTQKNNSRRYRHIRYFSGPSSNLSSLGSLPSVKQPKPVIGHAPDFKTAITASSSLYATYTIPFQGFKYALVPDLKDDSLAMLTKVWQLPANHVEFPGEPAIHYNGAWYRHRDNGVFKKPKSFTSVAYEPDVIPPEWRGIDDASNVLPKGPQPLMVGPGGAIPNSQASQGVPFPTATTVNNANAGNNLNEDHFRLILAQKAELEKKLNDANALTFSLQQQLAAAVQKSEDLHTYAAHLHQYLEGTPEGKKCIQEANAKVNAIIALKTNKPQTPANASQFAHNGAQQPQQPQYAQPSQPQPGNIDNKSKQDNLSQILAQQQHLKQLEAERKERERQLAEHLAQKEAADKHAQFLAAQQQSQQVRKSPEPALVSPGVGAAPTIGGDDDFRDLSPPKPRRA